MRLNILSEEVREGNWRCIKPLVRALIVTPVVYQLSRFASSVES